MQKPTIAIIGWTSRFWQFWKDYFEGKWIQILIASRTTDIAPEQAVIDADIIIFSVSIRSTVKVIHSLIPHIPEDKLILDFTGIKTEASKALSEYKLWEVVATHPMFWPWITTIQGQNIAFDPIQPWEKWNFLYNLWKEDGANLIELSSQRHDELVAIVQSTVHIMNLMLWHILLKHGIDIKELSRISTPNSRMQLFILARFLNQDASLYTDMQMENTVYKEQILPDIASYFSSITKIVQDGDTEGFRDEFSAIKNYIGQDFLDTALTVSSHFDQETKNIL